VRLALLTKRTRAHGFGGVESHGENFVLAAAALGHEPLVLTTAHPAGREHDEVAGVPVRYLAGTAPGVDGRAWWRLSADAIRELVAGAGCDVVFSTNLSGYGVAAARVPVPHYAFSTGRVLGHLASEWHDRAGARARLAYPKHALALVYYAGVERRLYRRVSAILAEDDRLYERLRRDGWPARLFYAGIDPRRFAPAPPLRERTRGALGIPANARVLLMVARVNRQKGIWLGVQAFERLARGDQGLHLIVVGDGPDRARLVAGLAGAPWRARVHFAGAVAPEATAAYYAAADLLLYPTFRIEGIPRAILEAMAAGLAVVATDRGGVRSAVLDGVTGCLLRAPALTPLVAATRGLLDAAPRRHAMGAAGRVRAAEVFDMRLLAARLLEEIARTGEPMHARS
jgi:glycosyltransferase involved in cell wall biosynthesis